MSNKQKTRSHRNKLRLYCAYIALPIIIIWSFYGMWNWRLAPNEWGDAYGSINALFSGLALIGAIVAIYLQSQELQLTRKEFEELANTARFQRFEHAFYNMLSGYQQLVSGFIWEGTIFGCDEDGDVHKQNITSTGYAFFDTIFSHSFWLEESGEPAKSLKDTIKRLYDKYDDYDKYDREDNSSSDPSERAQSFGRLLENVSEITTVQHFFRYLYRMLKFIDETNAFGDFDSEKLDKDEVTASKAESKIIEQKYQYIGILRAYISQSQYYIIYLDALNPDFSKMKTLFERWGFLKNLTSDESVLPTYQEYYRKGAFISPLNRIKE